MATQRVKLTFPDDLVVRPIIYELGRDFDIIPNIRRADIRDYEGWVILELDGMVTEIEKGLMWIDSIGIRVDLLSGDVLEG
tara:strand:+ start:440 stop:682 length:243 start_codon:yes stop_codon:yes gene_type:complete